MSPDKTKKPGKAEFDKKTVYIFKNKDFKSNLDIILLIANLLSTPVTTKSIII